MKTGSLHLQICQFIRLLLGIADLFDPLQHRDKFRLKTCQLLRQVFYMAAFGLTLEPVARLTQPYRPDVSAHRLQRMGCVSDLCAPLILC